MQSLWLRWPVLPLPSRDAQDAGEAAATRGTRRGARARPEASGGPANSMFPVWRPSAGEQRPGPAAHAMRRVPWPEAQRSSRRTAAGSQRAADAVTEL
jgi:hypothetical protein